MTKIKQGRNSPERKSAIDSALSLFTDVKAGEGVRLLLLLVNVFAILFAYYILKPVREGLLSGGYFGLNASDTKILLTGVSAGLLFGIVPAYSILVSKLSRLKLLNGSMGFVILSIAAFIGLESAGLRIGAAFYLWLSIVNLFLIAQFWSYANDLYTQEAGKRLFAVIAIGSSAGAMVGSKATGAGIITSTPGLLAAAAVLLAFAGVLYNVIDNMSEPSEEPEATPGTGDDAPSKSGGFGLVFKSRYLLLIAIMAMLTNIVNTTGEFVLNNAFTAEAADQYPDLEFSELAPTPDQVKVQEKQKEENETARGNVVRNLYGDFFFWVNLLGLLMQAFFVSRIFKYLGVRVALFVLPVIALGGYALIGVIGTMLIVRIAKTGENATEYSLQNTVKQTLFLPTSRDEKYKAKAAIDTFFVRGGDLLAAAISFSLSIGLGFGMRGFALVNVGFILLWLGVTVMIAAEHKKIAEE